MVPRPTNFNYVCHGHLLLRDWRITANAVIFGYVLVDHASA